MSATTSISKDDSTSTSIGSHTLSSKKVQPAYLNIKQLVKQEFSNALNKNFNWNATEMRTLFNKYNLQNRENINEEIRLGLLLAWQEYLFKNPPTMFHEYDSKQTKPPLQTFSDVVNVIINILEDEKNFTKINGHFIGATWACSVLALMLRDPELRDPKFFTPQNIEVMFKESFQKMKNAISQSSKNKKAKTPSDLLNDRDVFLHVVQFLSRNIKISHKISGHPSAEISLCEEALKIFAPFIQKEWWCHHIFSHGFYTLFLTLNGKEVDSQALLVYEKALKESGVTLDIIEKAKIEACVRYFLETGNNAPLSNNTQVLDAKKYQELTQEVLEKLIFSSDTVLTPKQINQLLSSFSYLPEKDLKDFLKKIIDTSLKIFINNDYIKNGKHNFIQLIKVILSNKKFQEIARSLVSQDVFEKFYHDSAIKNSAPKKMDIPGALFAILVTVNKGFTFENFRAINLKDKNETLTEAANLLLEVESSDQESQERNKYGLTQIILLNEKENEKNVRPIEEDLLLKITDLEHSLFGPEKDAIRAYKDFLSSRPSFQEKNWEAIALNVENHLKNHHSENLLKKYKQKMEYFKNVIVVPKNQVLILTPEQTTILLNKNKKNIQRAKLLLIFDAKPIFEKNIL